MNDSIMNASIRRNNGVFKSESRLWWILFVFWQFMTADERFFRSCYVAVILYIVGMVLMGAAFQNHLTIAAFIIGWGLVEIATMVNTVAICKYFL